VGGHLSTSVNNDGKKESALIAQAKSDGEAFGVLYEEHVDRIYNYLYYRTGNSHDAEDLTEKVFFRAMQHIDNYEDQGVPFSAWLYKIARNLLANWYRDESKRKMISLDKFEHRQSGSSPELVTELAEDKEALLGAIRRLPSERQELLILKFVERMSNAEIGLVLGRTEGAIKSLYHRTLLALRKEMQKPPDRPKKRVKRKPGWIPINGRTPTREERERHNSLEERNENRHG
jgi:RNA polymerase sigma-70 factor (ECF subfamily)